MRKLFFLFVFFSFHFINAQNLQDYVQYEFRRFSVDEGLSNNRVHSICQDKFGFLWFGTSDGLNRYDGYANKIYKHSSDEASIISNDIRVTFCDSHGNLWIGASKLQKYNYKKDNFEIFYDEHKHDISSPISIAEDKIGNLWICSFSGDLYKIPFDTINQTIILKFSHFADKSRNNTFRNIFIDSNSEIWVGTRNGLALLNQIDSTFTYYRPDEAVQNSIFGKDVTVIYEDSNELFWIGTFNSGLNVMDRKTGKFYHYKLDTTNEYSNRIRTIFEDNLGNFFVGTRAGLYIFDSVQNNFNYYAHTEHKYSVLSYNSILSNYKDNFGGLWIGTFAGGANYANLYKKPFNHLKYKPKDNDFLNNKSVYAIFEDSSGKIWIGTDQKGINVFNPETKKYTYYSHNADDPFSLAYNDIKAFAEDKSGNIWIGTNNGGLDCYQQSTGKFVHYISDDNNPFSINSNRIYALLYDSQYNLWIGTKKGVCLLPDNESKFIVYSRSLEGKYEFPDGEVHSIIEDSGKNVWVNGSRFSYTDSAFTKILPDSVYKSYILTICEDMENNFWFGSQAGLVFYNTSNQEITLFNSYNGLPSDYITGIIDDNTGNLWISTINGLVKYIDGVRNPLSGNFRIYSASDGLQSRQFNYSAVMKSSSGKIYFGGINGISAFYPSEIDDNPFKPDILITNLKLFNENVEIGHRIRGNVVLKKSILLTDTLTLTYKQNVFTLEYAAIHFAESAGNKYSYMLENLDEEWNNVGNKRFATYTNLNSGEYIFKVKATNSDGVWSGKPAEMRIIVLPPFWQTWWFRIIFIVGIIGLAVGFYYYRVNQLKNQKKTLERKVTERTIELQKANVALEERKEEVLQQNEEILQQNELLATQKSEIEIAYKNINVLSKIGQTITATLDIDDINQLIYEHVSSLMSIDEFGVGLYNDSKKFIEFIYFMKDEDRLPYFSVSTSEQENILALSVLTKKEIFTNDFFKDYPELITDFHNSNYEGCNSLIIIPLLVHKRFIGLMVTKCKQKNSFKDNDFSNLKTLASYLAIAIDNSNAYQIVEFQNDKISSSINYAKNIQRALLPLSENIDKYFNHFVIYRPRDVVSGDFYWFDVENAGSENEIVFIAVVDCTGHGVPGAFMSMIGNTLLNEIVCLKKIYQPKIILDELNLSITKLLKQDKTNNNDGMVVSLVRIDNLPDKVSKKLTFSGAKRPLYYSDKQHDEIRTIKGTIASIGGKQRANKMDFTDNELIISNDEMIYLTSDGFADQQDFDRKRFGSPRLKNLLSSISTLSVDEQHKCLNTELDLYMSGQEQRDDITILGIKI